MAFVTSGGATPVTKEDIYNALIGESLGNLVNGEVNYFADLPDPTSESGKIYKVNKRTANYWTLGASSRYLAGFYESDGVTWKYRPNSALPVYNETNGDTEATVNYRQFTPKNVFDIASKVEGGNTGGGADANVFVFDSDASLGSNTKALCHASGPVSLNVDPNIIASLDCINGAEVSLSYIHGYVPPPTNSNRVDLPTSVQIEAGEGVFSNKIELKGVYHTGGEGTSAHLGQAHVVTTNNVLVDTGPTLGISRNTVSVLGAISAAGDKEFKIGYMDTPYETPFDVTVEIIGETIHFTVSYGEVVTTREVPATGTKGWYHNNVSTVVNMFADDLLFYDTTQVPTALVAAAGTMPNSESIALPANFQGYIDTTGSLTVYELDNTGGGTEVLAGTGLNKSVDTFNLKIASDADLGGIKVGTGLTIDGNGQLSASATSEVTVTVADQTEMLALTQVLGGYRANRLDEQRLYYLNSNEDPGVIGNWIQGPSTANTVLSFSSRNGQVTPEKGDYKSSMVKVAHDNTGVNGFFGIDDTGIYWDDGFDALDLEGN